MGTNVGKYRQRVKGNREIIEQLSAEQYPCLYRLLNARGGAMRQRLLYLLGIAVDTKNQEGGEHGYWFFMPLSKMAGSSGIAKTRDTWKKTIILLCCLGLIERQIPTEESADTPYRQQAVEYAREHGKQRATAFFSVPEYNPRQLEYIESKARKWLESGANLQHFSKTTIIDTFGSAIANRVYQDERRKPKRTNEAEYELIETLLFLLERKQYTTRDELLSLAHQTGQRAAKATWERAGRLILAAAGARHYRPTAAEKERLGLEGNRWIITRNNRAEQ